MVRLVITTFAAVALALVTGCTTSKIRSQESQACSINSSDDPLLVCTPALDLICISTYSVMVTNPNEAKKFDGGVRHVYVCRLACATDDDCVQVGDVCCTGDIHGKTYNKMLPDGGLAPARAGCVPPALCESMHGSEDAGAPSPPPVDAAVDRPVDVRVADAAAPDAPAPDSAAPDAAAPDAGAGPDAAAD